MKKVILNRVLFAFIWLPILIVIFYFEENPNFSTLISFLSLILYLVFMLRLILIKFNSKYVFAYFVIGILPMISIMIGYFFDYNFHATYSGSNLLSIFLMVVLLLGSLFLLVMSILAITKGEPKVESQKIKSETTDLNTNN
jgi:bacteriorhodopsin